jgi:tungstate transport system substrate-binding protein
VTRRTPSSGSGAAYAPALAALLLLTLALGGCAGGDRGGSGADPAAGGAAPDRGSLLLATTTSTQDSGLLDELLPAFTRDTGRRVKTLAVGTGEALELGRRGEVDVLLVHAPAAEEELVATGVTGRRLLVMHNDFVLVGPPDDPAGVAGRPTDQALRTIARRDALFVSRGDDSGTEKKELDLWAAAGIDPGGSWYQSTGQGMGATLRVADQKGGYTLTDRATYLAQRDSLSLRPLVEGGPELLNVYHVVEITKRAGPRVRPAAARAFADWLVSPGVQRLIGRFGRAEFGRSLFTPDAGRAEDELGG